MTYTKEEINKIVNVKDTLGNPIDIFDLKFAVLITTGHNNTGWSKIFGENISFGIDDFEDCDTEESVIDTYQEQLFDNIKESMGCY